MFIIPFGRIRLHNRAIHCDTEKRRPPVWRDVERLDLVGVIGNKLPETPSHVCVGLVVKSCHPSNHREDAVPPKQSDGFAIAGRRPSLSDQL